LGRQATTHVQQIETNALPVTTVEDARGVAKGGRPLRWIGLLRPDMEGSADWSQAKRLGTYEEFYGELW
jgi:hypothetical protein